MALVYGGIAAQEVVVSLTFYIIKKNAFAPLEYHRQRMVIVRAVLFFEVNKMLCGRTYRY
jgi:hypothetical protein